MNKLYTMVGIPGAGKSTFANSHPECVVVSSDAIRAEVFKNEYDLSNMRRVFEIVNERVAAALAEGKDVIYDSTSLTRKIRHNIIKTFNAEHIAIFVNTPIDICIERDAKRYRHVGERVIRQMATRLVPPTLDEGFKEIIEI